MATFSSRKASQGGDWEELRWRRRRVRRTGKTTGQTTDQQYRKELGLPPHAMHFGNKLHVLLKDLANLSREEVISLSYNQRIMGLKKWGLEHMIVDYCRIDYKVR